MKRFSLVLSLLALFLSPGCARKTRTVSPPPVNDTLTRHLDGDPHTLDPIITTEEFGLRVEEMIFRGLVGLDRTRRFVPDLASSWAVSSDGLVYDFRLDPKARWEDGTPVTSDDVAFTIERVRDPKIAALIWKFGLEDLKSVETPDASTVIVRFQKPYAERLLAFTMPIVSAAAYRKGGDLDRRPAGSGPYRLESWTANQRIVLVRRDDSPVAALNLPFRRLVFRVIPDGNVRFRSGSAGELDEFRISRDQRAVAVRSPEFGRHNRIVDAPQFLIVQLTWNFKNPILADRRVRLALAHAWDRAEAAKRLYPPNGAALLSGPYPAGAPENAPDVRPVTFDPAESARLLDQAGWKPGSDGIRRQGSRKLSLEMLYQAGDTMTGNVAEIYRAAAARVGVEMRPRPLEWAAYSQRLAAGEFDVAGPSGQQYLPPNLDQYPYLHSSQAPPEGQNAGFYRDAAVDAALEAARREMNAARRLELYRQIHRLVAADPPGDFLWSVDQPWAVSRRLEGVEVSPFGLFHFLPGPLGWSPMRRAS
jgi:peptide/nickel transport system substrate-binding protein